MRATVATSCQAYDSMRDQYQWDLITDLFGGTKAMRIAGTKWLPQEEDESPEQYSARLKRTFLYGGFERTIDKNTGKIFASPVLLGEKTDPEIGKYAEDIDLAGRRLTTFGSQLFITASGYGLTHVLVDYPTDEFGNAKPRRPYAVELHPMDVIGWKQERIAGVMQLTELRFIKRETVPDEEWGEKEKTCVYVMRPGEYSRYEKNEKDEWYLTDSGPMSIGKIPLVSIYFNRTGFMQAKPPFLGLANLNLAHWQQYSDYRNYLRLCGMPTPCFAGFGGDDHKIPCGPNIAHITEMTEAKAWYMELSGGADAALRGGLDRLEKHMEIMGTMLTLGQAGQMTATEKVINTLEGDNFLTLSARTMQHALTDILRLMAEWKGKDPEKAVPQVNVNDDFGLMFGNEGELAEWSKARERGDITHKTYLEGLRKRGMLDEDFDINAEIEAARLERQSTGLITPEMQIGEENE